MSASRQQDLLSLIAILRQSVNLACEHSLDDTAHLLRMALLETQMKLHGITDDELRDFSKYLQKRAPSQDNRSVRSRTNVSMGLMQRLSRKNVGRKA